MRDRLCGLPGSFALVRCASCGLLYLSPRPVPAHIHVYYPKSYESFIKRRTGHLSPWQRYSLRYGLWKRCRWVLRYKRSGKLLDLGCGTGQFLAEMGRYPGWKLAGVEPNTEAADFARQALGLDVHLGDLFSAEFPDRCFDVVTMWDVLEHLYDPVAVLKEIGRVLKPDGVLILRTPSLDSWDARVFGRYWAGLDSPRHLAIYSRRTVKKLLAHAGFVVRELKTGSGSYFVCLLSLRFLLEEVVSTLWLRQLLMALAQNMLTRLALAVPLFVADSLGLGSEMLIVAQYEEARLGRG
ncbi:MAG: class I SAM-dependent methyltransferase [Anaerolineae bacterium]|nr:class I SAM-dependent methyltransferase [Anaerolineae bacterium]MDW8099850.1 class I SAM-dependent methyltransferase [Anaerolineae bacterium]